MIIMGSLFKKWYIHRDHVLDCSAKTVHILVWIKMASTIVSGIFDNLDILCDVTVASLVLSYSKWLSSFGGQSKELQD